MVEGKGLPGHTHLGQGGVDAQGGLGVYHLTSRATGLMVSKHANGTTDCKQSWQVNCSHKASTPTSLAYTHNDNAAKTSMSKEFQSPRSGFRRMADLMGTRSPRAEVTVWGLRCWREVGSRIG